VSTLQETNITFSKAFGAEPCLIETPNPSHRNSSATVPDTNSSSTRTQNEFLVVSALCFRWTHQRLYKVEAFLK
jgi:hypothetical protein